MNNQEYIKVTLPEMKTFKSLKKDIDPFMKFWNFITAELGTDIKGFDVSSVRLTLKDYEELKKYAFQWFKKQSPMPILAKRKQESSFGFHCLNIAPSEFYDKNDQPESGFIYVETNWKVAQEENLKYMQKRGA